MSCDRLHAFITSLQGPHLPENDYLGPGIRICHVLTEKKLVETGLDGFISPQSLTTQVICDEWFKREAFLCICY